jgi:hypothetical protein
MRWAPHSPIVTYGSTNTCIIQYIPPHNLTHATLPYIDINVPLHCMRHVTYSHELVCQPNHRADGHTTYPQDA